MNPFCIQEKIGNTRYVTPDGFLLCKDVPIARIGEFQYRESETPPLKGINGIVTMKRTPEVLFNPATIASFESKPILDGYHQNVTPDNYRDVTVGTVNNVRRGKGEQEDLLLADLLIMDRTAIERIENGAVGEVSIGFDASYKQIGEGLGEQVDLLGNHVALVQDGRAGDRCSIGDKKPEEVEEMEEKNKAVPTADSVDMGVLERIFSLLGKGKKEEEGGDANVVPDPNGDVGERLAKIENALAKLLPVEEEEHGTTFDEDTIKKLADAVVALLKKEPDGTVKSEGDQIDLADCDFLEDEETVEEVMEEAEIVEPGIEMPSGDSATAISSLRINALNAAMKTDENVRGLVASIVGGSKRAADLARSPKALTRAAFKAVVAAKRSDNNESFATGVGRFAFGDKASKNQKYVAPMTGADLQAIYDRAKNK